MLMFNNNDICSNKNRNVLKNNKGKTSNMKKVKKNKGKRKRKSNMKSVYKRICNRKKCSYSSKSVGGGRSKKSKVSRKRKISKKNTQFLEGLGLKVKQKQ